MMVKESVCPEEMIEERPIKKHSQFGLAMERLLNDPISVIAMIVLVILVLIAIFASVIAPYEYDEVDLTSILATPSLTHLCGTDDLGRDIFSRLIYGTGNSILIGVLSTAVAMIIGVTLGLAAGYFGGISDTVIMRFMDILQSIPSMLLAIAISAALGIGMRNCIIALAVGHIAGFARMARAASLNIAGVEYVEAARAMNLKSFTILLRHVLPNSLSPLIVQGTMMVAIAVMNSAGLSFIGLGVQPPQAEWGCMLAAGRTYLRSYPHTLIFPLLAILILVLSLNLLGDGLRDALDPKLKK
ncbi:MAG: ABC transporter permease [Oscillospiraceae bacterium]|nr:ABC transporter permease [Oscillospiraceae bacterium]